MYYMIYINIILQTVIYDRGTNGFQDLHMNTIKVFYLYFMQLYQMIRWKSKPFKICLFLINHFFMDIYLSTNDAE